MIPFLIHATGAIPEGGGNGSGQIKARAFSFQDGGKIISSLESFFPSSNKIRFEKALNNFERKLFFLFLYLLNCWRFFCQKSGGKLFHFRSHLFPPNESILSLMQQSPVLFFLPSAHFYFVSLPAPGKYKWLATVKN